MVGTSGLDSETEYTSDCLGQKVSWDNRKVNWKVSLSVALSTTQEKPNPKKDSFCPSFLWMEWDEEWKLKDGCAQVTKMPESLKEKGIQM